MSRELANSTFRNDFERAVRNAVADLRERADRLEELAANTQGLDIYGLLHLTQSLEQTANARSGLSLTVALQSFARNMHEVAWQAEQPTSE